MTRPGATARVALGAPLFLLLGCVSVLGIDDSKKDAATTLCNCPDLDQIKSTCRAIVTDRLGKASPETRSSWLRDFDSCFSKQACGCAVTSFATAPTCTETGDSCLLPGCKDCCNSTGTDVGVCS